MTSHTLPVGLTSMEAAARIRAEGYNELPHTGRRTPFRILIEVFREPMLLLLAIGGLLYLGLGDLPEAMMLLTFGAMSIVITVVQEARTERVLDALRDLASPRAIVIRDGTRQRIAGREIVRGDLIVLSEGDRVAADATLREASDLQIDESLLTGESVPVRKSVTAGATQAASKPGGDDQPYVYSGCLIVRGQGLAVATATGSHSEIGKIGQILHGLEPEAPRLRQQTARLVKLCGLGGMAVSIATILLYGSLRGDWLQAILSGIAISMSLLPEEFPVVLTVFLAMGAWRISKARVLTRRAAAIETLGSATVLCTDKTGTLTQNSMRVAELRLSTGRNLRGVALRHRQTDRAFTELLQFGVLASSSSPFDPMEIALHDLCRTWTQNHSGDDLTLIQSYSLRPELLAMTQVWRRLDGSLAVAAKGAPEAIARLCRLPSHAHADLQRALDSMAQEGLRVLGVAAADHDPHALPAAQEGFAFRFLGLVGLADPLRNSVPDAIRQCRGAGIRVVMITGDYPTTALAIAKQAGLADANAVTGDQIQGMAPGALAECVKRNDVFARITPDQKLRIVEALKGNGEIVAMTGDGVNDAPSLRAAHIGIAMGGRGTDVAREASSIVLMDDDFGSIVSALRLGRRIYDNLRKAMAFIVAVHVPIAGLALLPLTFGLPLMLAPVHIALLELIIDPVCALVFEAEREERDTMNRPPRRPNSPLFTWALVGWSALQGALALGLVASVFVFSLRSAPDDEARTLTFFSLVISIVALTLANRSFSASYTSAFLRPNRAFAIILLVIAAILALTTLWPPALSLFRFGTLHITDLGIAIAIGGALLALIESIKPLWFSAFRS